MELVLSYRIFPAISTQQIPFFNFLEKEKNKLNNEGIEGEQINGKRYDEIILFSPVIESKTNLVLIV